MYIIRSVQEFKQIMAKPNPKEIYALIPQEFDVLSSKPEDLLRNETDCAVYADIEISNGKDKIVKFNPSFDAHVLAQGFSLTSPIFVKTSRPIKCQGEELDQVVLEVLRQVVGIHIPEPIFRWKQNFYIGPVNETSIAL